MIQTNLRFTVILATTVIIAAGHAGADDQAKLKNAPPDGSAIAGSPDCGSSCSSDINGSGTVNVDDLLAVINAWGPCPGCPADINGDGMVNVDDLLAVVNGWGPCPAPSNDNCTNAISTGLPVFGPSTVTFCTTTATTDGPPEPGCLFCCLDPQIHKDIWYKFSTLGGAGTMQIDTCGSTFDTKIAVYRTNGGACACPGAGATLVACNDDDLTGACGLLSRVQFDVLGNSCYLVRVGGYNDASGPGVMHMQLFSPGDECFTAINLGMVTATSPADVSGSNFALTPGTMVLQAPCTDLPDGSDVWYKFTIGCGGNIIGAASTCNPGTNFDTIVTLYKGSCNGLTLVGCNDDTGQTNCLLNGLPRKSLVSLPNAPSPDTYYVRISGYDGATGTYELTVAFQCIN